MATIVRKKSLGNISSVEEVKNFLAENNITYDFWEVPASSNPFTSKETLNDLEKEELLQTLNHRFEYLKQKEGYQTRDLVVLHPNVPGIKDMLAKFDKVHYHTDEEVRYIIDGSGIFGFVGKGEKFLVHVVKGDFISIPRNTNHWFYLDEAMRIKAVRYFVDTAGWVPNYVEETTSIEN
ncbi:MAG: cupin domain-containing protein [Leptospiraceae bacterium]|nr:cupin domain-containing protein [Leptospiraceae bacterium]